MAYMGFPANYQPAYQQQYREMYSQQMPVTSSPAQLMSPPTIHAEIVQVSSKEEAANFPVGAGQSQMMMARDDSAIYIKTVYANGQATLIEYTKAVPKTEPTPDYVTRAEFEERIAEIVKQKTPRKKEAQDEPVV